MARQYQQMESLTLIRHRCSCKQITFLVIKQKQLLLEESLRNVSLAFYVSSSGLHTNKLTFDNYPVVRQLCKLRFKTVPSHIYAKHLQHSPPYQSLIILSSVHHCHCAKGGEVDEYCNHHKDDQEF